MDSDEEPCVNVRIPHGHDLDDLGPDVWCVLVPGPLVSCAIDTLQAVLAQWHDDEGNSPDDDKWGPILAAAGYVLGGLLHAQTTRDSRRGARRLVAQVEHFCTSWTRTYLEALRGEPETAYIVDALLRVQEEAERRLRERMHKESERRRNPQQAAAEQAAAEQATGDKNQAQEADAGWEF